MQSFNSKYTPVISATTLYSVPLAPSLLTGSGISESSSYLSWTDNSFNEFSYRVERKTLAGSFAEVGSVGPNITNYTDSIISPQDYIYRVRALNPRNYSSYSNQAIVLGTPTGSAIQQISGTSLRVSWFDNSQSELGFKLERKLSGSYSLVSTSTSTFFNDTGVAAGNYYTYRILAYSSSGNSAYSTEVSGFFYPSITESLTLSVTMTGSGNVAQNSFTGINNATGYIIQRSDSNSGDFQTVNTIPNQVSSAVYEDTLPATARSLENLRSGHALGIPTYTWDNKRMLCGFYHNTATGYVATSDDKGLTWTNRYSISGWGIQKMLSSNDRTKLACIAVQGFIGTALFYSNNGGASFYQPVSGNYSFTDLAMSENGDWLYAIDAIGGGDYHVIHNGVETISQGATIDGQIACNQNGQYVCISQTNAVLYSTNYGSGFTQIDPLGGGGLGFPQLKFSPDANKLFLGNGGQWSVSTDGAVHANLINYNSPFGRVLAGDISDDGKTLIIARAPLDASVPLYVDYSTDAGRTWVNISGSATGVHTGAFPALNGVSVSRQGDSLFVIVPSGMSKVTSQEHYYYKAVALNPINNIESNIVGVIATVNETPTGLTGSRVSTTGVQLSWTINHVSNTGAELFPFGYAGHEIFRRYNSSSPTGFSFLTTVSGGINSYLDNTALTGAPAVYDYKVRLKADMTGLYSPFSSVFTQST